jgi:hypothetical protein
MTKPVEPFEMAIRQSMEALKASGQPITQASIIANAKFENGTPVGRSTLYKTNKKTGLHVHAELLKDVRELTSGVTPEVAEKQKAKKEKLGKAELAVSKNALKESEKIIKELAAALTLSELDAEQLRNNKSADRHSLVDTELKLYTVVSALNKLSHGFFDEFQKLEKALRTKHGSTPSFKEADSFIARKLQEYESSKTIAFGRSPELAANS